MSQTAKNTTDSLERPLTIDKGHVTAHAWKFDENVATMDFSKHLQLTTDTIHSLKNDDKPAIVFIVGPMGSGKSIFRSVLQHNTSDSEVIDLYDKFDLKSKECKSVDISHMINDSSKTYIIDEAACADLETMAAAVNSHADNGGAAILMFQCIKHVNRDLFNGMTVFYIDQDEFKSGEAWVKSTC